MPRTTNRAAPGETHHLTGETAHQTAGHRRAALAAERQAVSAQELYERSTAPTRVWVWRRCIAAGGPGRSWHGDATGADPGISRIRRVRVRASSPSGVHELPARRGRGRDDPAAGAPAASATGTTSRSITSGSISTGCARVPPSRASGALSSRHAARRTPRSRFVIGTQRTRPTLAASTVSMDSTISSLLSATDSGWKAEREQQDQRHRSTEVGERERVHERADVVLPDVQRGAGKARAARWRDGPPPAPSSRTPDRRTCQRVAPSDPTITPPARDAACRCGPSAPPARKI